MVKRGASKRERKQRDANSCRQKARKGLKSGAVLPGAPVSACSKEDGAPETDGATGPAAAMLSTAAVLPAPVLLDETLFPGLAAGYDSMPNLPLPSCWGACNHHITRRQGLKGVAAVDAQRW